MKTFKTFVFTIIISVIAVSSTYAQCYNGRCSASRYYSPSYGRSCYSGNCYSGNCYSGNCYSNNYYNGSCRNGSCYNSSRSGFSCQNGSCFASKSSEFLPIDKTVSEAVKEFNEKIKSTNEKVDERLCENKEEIKDVVEETVSEEDSKVEESVVEEDSKVEEDNSSVVYAHCNGCGTNLEFDTNKTKFICPYCKHKFVVVDGEVYGALTTKKSYTNECEKKFVAENVINNIASRLLNSINATRARFNRTALTYDARISAGAQQHANTMAAFGCIFHGKYHGGLPENVAAGQVTPEDCANTWENSTDHLNNILNASYSCGIGYARGRDGRLYWALRLN